MTAQPRRKFALLEATMSIERAAMDVEEKVFRAFKVFGAALVDELRGRVELPDEAVEPMLTRALVRALRRPDASPDERAWASELERKPPANLWRRVPGDVPNALVAWARFLTGDIAKAAANDNGEPEPDEWQVRHRGLAMMRTAYRDLLKQTGPEGPRLQPLDPQAPTSAEVVTDDVLAAEGRPLLKTPLARNLCQFLARHAREQKASGMREWRRVKFESWTDAAAAVGTTRSEDVYDLRRISHALHRVRVHMPRPKGTAPLFGLTDAVGEVSYLCDHGLLTSMVYSKDVEEWTRNNRHELDADENRKLTPLLEHPIPVVGRKNEHGAILRLADLVLVHLTAPMVARTLASGGAALVDAWDWRQLAAEAGLPTTRKGRQLLDRIISRWCREPTAEERSKGDTAPAFLRRIGPDRYDLAAAHAAAREFIVDGGDLSERRAELALLRASKARTPIKRK